MRGIPVIRLTTTCLGDLERLLSTDIIAVVGSLNLQETLNPNKP